jgi:hypothetical protein
MKVRVEMNSNGLYSMRPCIEPESKLGFVEISPMEWQEYKAHQRACDRWDSFMAALDVGQYKK